MKHPLASILVLACLLTTTPTLRVRGAEETETQREARHERVAARREGVHIICHRGVADLAVGAHENTVEAYRAAFELGADGNEIDIRVTKDGVLVCFHDDMLDHLLDAYGDVSDYTWSELQSFRFRNPGRFKQHCRIPKLSEVFELHRDYSGLMHLDVKAKGLVEPISALLDKLDMWDHVVSAPQEFSDPRFKPTRSKAGLYLDRGEVNPQAIAAALKKPGERIILEYPVGVAHALGRRITTPSIQPVLNQVAHWASTPVGPNKELGTDEQLLQVLQDADDWNQVARGEAEEQASAKRILQRAIAADELARRNVRSPNVLAALERRARERSLHRSWRYCGLDGYAALRALISLQAPQAVEVARFCIWRDDPAIKAAMNPEYNNPPSWTDWRTKVSVFQLLESLPGQATEQLCRDYLKLSDATARQIGVPLFERAASTLLRISSRESTAHELLSHRSSAVRGRVTLDCLAQASEPWALRAISQNIPEALSYIPPGRIRLALVGDSTVASYPKPPADRPDLTGWGQVLDQFFTPAVHIANDARSGRSSKSFIREGQWRRTLAGKPNYVLIQFGHNDQPGKGDRTTDPKSDFRDYLRQYISDAKAIGAHPILVTPVARRTFRDGKVNSSLGPWAEAMHAVGRELDAPVIDLHAASLRLLDNLGDEGSSDFSPSVSDRTHFSRKGAVAMAELVVGDLRTVAPHLALLLRDRKP